MKAAVIGASAESIHTIEKAKEYGITVVALDGDPGAAGLKKADRPYTVNIRDVDEVIECLMKEQPDFLLTAPIGRYLTTTGAANDALGLPGVSFKAAQLCTDKWTFHETLKAAGLRNCVCLLVPAKLWLPTADQAREMHALLMRVKTEMHYPVILKPRFGSGSRAVYCIQDDRELMNALAQLLEHADEDFVLEDMQDGEEYGADAAVDEEGVHLILLRKKQNTPLPARQAVSYESVRPGELTQQVKGFLEKLTQAMGIKNSLMHCDLILKEGESPFVIEASARPSGHFLHDFFTPYASGIDPAEQMIRCRLGLPHSFEPARIRPCMIHYFNVAGKADNVPTEKKAAGAARNAGAVLKVWNCEIGQGNILDMPDNGHVLMERGYFVLDEADEKSLSDAAEAVLRLFGAGARIVQ